MRRGILAGGNWIVDKLKVVDTYPREEALANILAESVGNGGSPFNVLVDLALLGAPFPLAGIGLVGADPDGAWIQARCAEHGIDARQVRAHPQARTSYTDVMTVRDTGRRTFFHHRGANAFLDATHFDFAAAEGGRIFHLGYLLLLDRLDEPDSECGTTAARVLHRARQAGFKTSIDVVSEDSRRFAEIVPPALRHADYCFLNDFELERTTGIETRPGGRIRTGAVEDAAQRLLEAGASEWIIVHFPEGACAVGRNGASCFQGSVRVPAERIRSTVGAGDAFAAGVLIGLHEELPIQTALEYGAAAAAGSLLGAGSSDALAPLDECLALKHELGVRTAPFTEDARCH